VKTVITGIILFLAIYLMASGLDRSGTDLGMGLLIVGALLIGVYNAVTAKGE